jgi:hypothetical protein
MFHPESESIFEVDASELPALYESTDGALCNDVTGNPEFEARFKQQRSET